MSESGGGEVVSDGKAPPRNFVEQIVAEMDRRAQESGGEQVPYAEYITLLESHRRKCVEESSYVEADLARHVLKELRMQEERDHISEMKTRQAAERRGVEEAFEFETQTVGSLWEERLSTFEERAAEAEKALREKHVKEFQEFHEEARTGPGSRIKFSKRLINMREIERKLAVQEKYAQAQKVKEASDAVQEEEMENFRALRAQALAKKEARLIQRQQNELRVFRKRISTNRNDLRRRRNDELSRIQKRFENVRRGLEGAQTIEKARTDRFLKNHEISSKMRTSGGGLVEESVDSGTRRSGSRASKKIAPPLGAKRKKKSDVRRKGQTKQKVQEKSRGR